MAKLNITMDDRLLQKMDAYADENYMTRSGLIAMCCNQYLNQQELFSLIKQMSASLRKISNDGKVDDSTLKQLEDFETVCRLCFPER